MTADSSVFLDTNVLLSATAPARPLHRAALRVLNDWPRMGRRLAVSGQVLREYLAVVTRPEAQNGLGLELGSALANISELRHRLRFADESSQCFERFHRLLVSAGSTGKQVHDANIVAAALTAGVTQLVTGNPRDFTRFAAEIEIIDLHSVAAAEST